MAMYSSVCQMTTSIRWCSSFRCKLEPRGAHPSNKEILCSNSIRQGSTRHLESHERNAGKHVIAIKIVDNIFLLIAEGLCPLRAVWCSCTCREAAWPWLQPRHQGRDLLTSHQKHTPMGHRAGSWAKRCSFATDRNRSGVASPCAEVCAPMFLMFLVVSEAKQSCVCWNPLGMAVGEGSLLWWAAHTRLSFSAFQQETPYLLTEWSNDTLSLEVSEWRKGTSHNPRVGGQREAVMEGQGLSCCTWVRHTSGYQKHTAGSHFVFLNNLNFCYLVLAWCFSQSHLSLSHPYYLEKWTNHSWKC